MRCTLIAGNSRPLAVVIVPAIVTLPSAPSITGEITFDGLNRASGKPFDVLIPKAVITPTSGMDLLAQGFQEAEFEARLVTIAPYTSPFEVNFPLGV